MSEKVIYARYRARASSKHRFFAFLTSPMDSPCKNTQDRGAPPRENIHVDKKKYSYHPSLQNFFPPHCAFNENLSEKSYNSGFLRIVV